MRASRLTFVRVARGSTPSTAVLRPGVNEVSPFLTAHAAGLQVRADEGSAANASFKEGADLQLMEDIRSGSDADFLAAADGLGKRLVDEMNKVPRPAPGLFVCTTLVSDTVPADRLAVVLKLEVVSEQGAVLELLDNGEETLTAVTDVLDRPGDLQKGLVFPDVRPASQAVVGDKAAQQEARYFLRGMGVTLQARETRSAAALVTAIDARAGRAIAERVLEELPAVSSGSTTVVLDALQRTVPGLSEEAASRVAEDLVKAERPVGQIDTAAPVTGKMRAGALTVTGPAGEIHRIRSERDPEGGWLVSFRSDLEPTVTWR